MRGLAWFESMRRQFPVLTDLGRFDFGYRIFIKKRNGAVFMIELSRIQKEKNLNQVVAIGGIGNGGAHKHYVVYHQLDLERDETRTDIKFQQGPVDHANGKEGGVTNQDLLEIVRHRLQGFQSGELKNRDTAMALTHIEEALLWLNKRTQDREERGVLGTLDK